MELATSAAPDIIRKRKPRFFRAGLVKFRLQERDLEIIRLIHQYRLLGSDHILALVPGSRKNLLKRLSVLFHSGYLERPPEQIKFFRLGSRPLIYGLGRQGAEVLHHELGMPLSKTDWTRKNREVKQLFLQHTLEISNFQTCLALACRNHGAIRVMPAEGIVQGRPLLNVKTSFRFKGQNYNLSYSLEPDIVFALNFVHDPPGSNRSLFLAEVDRSSMPVKRTNPYKSSFQKKILGYWESWQKGMFKEVFGFQHARIITVAKSKERIASMIKVVRELGESGKAPRMFLFALESDFNLHNPDNALAPIWQNANDNKVASLID